MAIRDNIVQLTGLIQVKPAGPHIPDACAGNSPRRSTAAPLSGCVPGHTQGLPGRGLRQFVSFFKENFLAFWRSLPYNKFGSFSTIPIH